MPRNISTSTDIQAARKALADRMRELRRAAGLTGKQLADSLSWQASKVSKIEHAKQPPSDQDVRDWCRVTGAERETDKLLVDLHTMEERYREFRREFRGEFRGGIAQHQDGIRRRESETRLLRVFEPVYVPGLLQTPDYARARFVESARKYGHQQEIDDAVAARMRRQEILHLSDRRFHFIITEAVLHYTMCPPEAMLGQVYRMMELSTLPNVSLGVIPFETNYVIAPKHGFWLHDTALVKVETFTIALSLTQAEEVEAYEKFFESFALAAVHDRKARALLTDAAERYVARVGRDSERRTEQS
ncbi:helix-turn-helix transcriptional regulator [Myceligenerans halotolerans]